MIKPPCLPCTTFRHPALVVIALGVVLVMLTSCGGGGHDDDSSPPAITLDASGISPSEIALAWTPVGRRVGDYQIFMDGFFFAETSFESFNVVGLMPNTQYCFRVGADVADFLIPFFLFREQSNVACATTLPAP